MPPCTGSKGFELVGFGWTRRKDGVSWRRHILRQCRECKGVSVQESFWVREGFDFCPRCLSQNVVRVRRDTGYRFVCGECGQETEDDTQ